MEIDGYLFIIICYLIIITSGYFINKFIKFQTDSNRFESIDGFRGLLATGVFIHHSIIWYNFLHFGKWEVPKNILGIHLGESCVAFFFMITSFLFTNKILNSKQQNFIFWKNLFYSRIFRLVPLYFLIITFCIVFILIVNKFTLNYSLYIFIVKCFKWYSFTILGNPGFSSDNYITIPRMLSGVTWSLPYEWLFYFSTPLISLGLLRNKNILSIIIAFVFIIIYSLYQEAARTHVISFLGGMIPAFIIYFYPKINLNKKIISIITIACLIISFSFESSNNNYYSKSLLIIAFILISLKNDIFGILKSNTLKYLGEISYSTYLIHGIIIFITFYIIGFDNVKNFTPNMYTLIICLLAILLITICSITFYKIEKPFMNIYYKLIKK